MVVIRVGARLVALSVGTVVGIRSFGTETTQALPPLLREATSEAVSAIGILDAELLLFLGAARLVPETVLALAVAEALAS
jgi:chemotaxis signal transduction protein